MTTRMNRPSITKYTFTRDASLWARGDGAPGGVWPGGNGMGGGALEVDEGLTVDEVLL